MLLAEARANLALARHQLRGIEESLELWRSLAPRRTPAGCRGAALLR